MSCLLTFHWYDAVEFKKQINKQTDKQISTNKPTENRINVKSSKLTHTHYARSFSMFRMKRSGISLVYISWITHPHGGAITLRITFHSSGKRKKEMEREKRIDIGTIVLFVCLYAIVHSILVYYYGGANPS